MDTTPKLVNLIGPDGQFYNGPEDIVQGALEQGYRLATDEDYRRDDIKQNLSGPLGSALTGIYSAADSALLGAPSAITKQVAPESYEMLEIAREANPIASGVGTGAGIVGSLVVGGPAFNAVTGAGKIAGEAVEQGVSRVAGQGVAKAAGTVARYGTEGAAYALPMAAPEAILGDAEAAAETLIAGGLLGAGLGAGFEATSSIVGSMLTIPQRLAGAGKKASGKASTVREAVADSVETAGETLAGRMEAAGQSVTNQAPSLAQRIEPTLEAARPKVVEALDYIENNQWEKVLGMNTKTIRNTLMGGRNSKNPNLQRPQELVEFAKSEGLLPKELGGEGSFFSRMEFDANKVMQEVQKRQDDVGFDIRWTLNEIDKTGKRFVVTSDLVESFNKLEKAVSKYDLVGADERIIGRIKEKFLPALVKKNGDPRMVKLTTLHDMSKDLSQFIYRNKRNPAVNTDIAQDARWAIRDVIDDALKGADMQFETLQGTPISNKWTELNKKYHDFADLKLGLKNLIDQEGNNTFTGMTGLISALAGGTVAGIPGLAIGAGGGYFMRNYGPQTAALLAQKAKEAIAKRDKLINGAVESFLSRAGGEFAEAAQDFRGAAAQLAKNIRGKGEPFEQVSNRVTQLSSDPDALVERLTALTGWMQNHHPELGTAVNGQLQRTIQFLEKQAPRPALPPSPFETDFPAVSDRELYSYEIKLRAAMDPYTVVEDIRRGVLQPEAVQTVKELYPKFHDQIVSSIISKAGEKKRKYSYAQRAQLSILLGSSVDKLFSPESLTVLQQNYRSPDAAQSPQKAAQLSVQSAKPTEMERVTFN